MDPDSLEGSVGRLRRCDSLGRPLDQALYVAESPGALGDGFSTESGAIGGGGDTAGEVDLLIDAFDAAWMGGSPKRGVSALPKPDMLRSMTAAAGDNGTGTVHGTGVCVTSTGMAITHGHASPSVGSPGLASATAAAPQHRPGSVPSGGAPVPTSTAGRMHADNDVAAMAAMLPMTPPPPHAPLSAAHLQKAQVGANLYPPAGLSTTLSAPRATTKANNDSKHSEFASVFFSPIQTNMLGIPRSESNDSFIGGTSVGSPDPTLRGGRLASSLAVPPNGDGTWEGGDMEEPSPSTSEPTLRSPHQISAHPRMPAIREGGGSPDVASHALNKQGSAASSAQEGVVSSNSDGSPSMPGMHALAATKAGSDASGDHPMLSMLHGSLNGTSLVPHLGGGGSALLPGHPGGISIAAVASAKSKKVPWGDLKLIAGTAMIPHIDKTEKGGEDAFCICLNGLGAIGVADGVSGWAEEGIDPAEYSRSLMRFAAAALQESTHPHGADPREVIRHAHQLTVMPGSSTICVCVMKPNGKMHIANLGDSGVRLIRGGRIVFASTAQQHMFNMPFQLSHPSIIESPDDADCAEVTLHDMQPGDIVILATDGLYDNVFDVEIAEVVADALAARARARAFDPEHAERRGGAGGGDANDVALGGDGAGGAAAKLDSEDAEHVAKAIAHTAHTYAQNPYRKTPWSVSAAETGMPWARFFVKGGGKMDDVTVVVAFVQEVDSSAST
mmetsp:Transcript_33569/g.99949  ORF Transcript_33569/g.99949 Transcript_33569/m.99949 type:complete len:728 (-) Transcript_33569:879-3062(-)